MLQASDVWFGYDEQKPVLRGVSLAVPAAGIVGILGPNGSGKTTLLRMLAGTRQPQRGSVTLDGAPLTRFSRAALARRMAVVPQETQLAFDYTVSEVAMMGRYPHLGPFEIEGPADLAVIEETLTSTGTLHLKDRLFATLSGGEKQRVVIAAALAQIFRLKAEATQSGTEAGFLLLDEPTASLDLGYQLEVASLLTQLHEERRVAIVISTHDLGLAGTLCDSLMLIRDGVVIANGPTDEVLTADNVRQVYGVEADVIRHPSGHRVVVPVRRTPGAPRE
jgi:iron complex transport system ATP-binding protein